ncbi:MAG: hypothetical protein WCP12_05430 [bacterium]
MTTGITNMDWGITAIGFHAVGGWDALTNLPATQPHPLAGKEGPATLSTRSFL